MAVRPEESVEVLGYSDTHGKLPVKVGTKQHFVKFEALPGNNSFQGRTTIHPQYSHLVDCDLFDHGPGQPQELHVIFSHRIVVLRGFNLHTHAQQLAAHTLPAVTEEGLGANGNQFVDLDKAVVTGMDLMGPPE